MVLVNGMIVRKAGRSIDDPVGTGIGDKADVLDFMIYRLLKQLVESPAFGLYLGEVGELDLHGGTEAMTAVGWKAQFLAVVGGQGDRHGKFPFKLEFGLELNLRPTNDKTRHVAGSVEAGGGDGELRPCWTDALMRVLLKHGRRVRDLPTWRAGEGDGQQFVHELGHRLAPVFGFMVESAHHVPRDAGHVVTGTRHMNDGLKPDRLGLSNLYSTNRHGVAPPVDRDPVSR